MRWLALLLIGFIVVQSASAVIVVRRPSGATAWSEVEDDFERADSSDLGSNWTEAIGDWEIGSGILNMATGESTGTVIWSSSEAGVKQRIAWIFTSSASNVHYGAKFRIPNLTDTTDESYTIRNNTTGTDALSARYCIGTGCTDIGTTHANTVAVGDWIIGEVAGTGSSTEFAAWDTGSTSEPDLTAGSLGDATVCWCDGGTCSLIANCSGTATIIDAEPGAGNYADCSSTCYMGFYGNSGSDPETEHWKGATQ